MTVTSPPVYNGRYELSHQIARGGTAQVYLARDLLLDRPVALKVLFPELSTDHSFVERFRREAQAAANLSHPNIVPVLSARFEAGAGLTAVCMPFLGAATLIGAARLAWAPPWGADYRSFWAASWLVLHGRPADVYVPAVHRAIQVIAPDVHTWSAFFYPPTWLLVCVPLALLKPEASALCWMAVTAVLFIATIWPVLPKRSMAVCLVLLCALIFDNYLLTQNGLLIASIFILAVRWLDARPVLSGICFGLLVIKPQFGIVLPFALAASGRWRGFVGAAASGAVLVWLSVLAFGFATWIAFARVIPSIPGWLGLERPGLMLSVLGAARILGAPMGVAYLAQIVTTVATCAVTAAVARRSKDPELVGSAICVGAVLASPWTHDYDLAILMFPLAWLLDRLGDRAAAWESAVFFLAVLFLIAAPHVLTLRLELIPVLPVILVGLLGMIWRRACPPPGAVHRTA